MKGKKKGIWLAVVACIVVVVASYATWNRLDPANTCAGCHEIKANHESWLASAHADIHCIECHGTAVSGGLHSLKEKTNMVLTHFTSDKRDEDICLSEEQVLDVSVRCAECHQSEHAGWLAGGHGITYKDIFLDGDHNRMERPYPDCFRCHGMFYDGNLQQLMGDLEGGPDTYRVVDTKQTDRPVMPCLACHQMHTDKGYPEHPKTSLYVRSEKMHLRTDYLTKVDMQDNGRPVLTSDDPNSLLCLQCHSPNAWHQAGSEDDRTPTGVHEGIGCLACHQPHSNLATASCDNCHPAMSNCGVDVKTMNTTYTDLKSPNNIHHITCASCHDDRSDKRNIASLQPKKMLTWKD